MGDSTLMTDWKLTASSNDLLIALCCSPILSNQSHWYLMYKESFMWTFLWDIIQKSYGKEHFLQTRRALRSYIESKWVIQERQPYSHIREFSKRFCCSCVFRWRWFPNSSSKNFTYTFCNGLSSLHQMPSTEIEWQSTEKKLTKVLVSFRKLIT